MDRRIRYTAGLLTLVGLAACGRQPATVSEDMQRDLDLAGTSAVELAPRAAQTQVVSAIELGKAAEAPKPEAPQAAPVRQTPRAPKAQVARHAPAAPAATQQVASAPEPKAEPEPRPVAEAPSPVAEAPAPAPEPTVERAPAQIPTTPVPSPSRGRSRGRSGGWWSTGDVIRNAPFPINP